MVVKIHGLLTTSAILLVVFLQQVLIMSSAEVPLGEDGQPLSKNALKRLQKAQEQAKKKAEKAAARPAAPEAKAKGNEAEQEEEMDEASYFDFRCKAMKNLEVSMCNPSIRHHQSDHKYLIALHSHSTPISL